MSGACPELAEANQGRILPRPRPTGKVLRRARGERLTVRFRMVPGTSSRMCAKLGVQTSSSIFPVGRNNTPSLSDPGSPRIIRGPLPERWQSGRMYLTRNQAYVNSVPWVRIPPSPPATKTSPERGFFCSWGRGCVDERTRVRQIRQERIWTAEWLARSAQRGG